MRDNTFHIQDLLFQKNTKVVFPLPTHWGIPTSDGTHFLSHLSHSMLQTNWPSSEPRSCPPFAKYTVLHLCVFRSFCADADGCSLLLYKAPVHLGTSGAKGWGVHSDGRQRNKMLSSDDVHENSGYYGNTYYNATQSPSQQLCGLSALVQNPSKLYKQACKHIWAHTHAHT